MDFGADEKHSHPIRIRSTRGGAPPLFRARGARRYANQLSFNYFKPSAGKRGGECSLQGHYYQFNSGSSRRIRRAFFASLIAIVGDFLPENSPASFGSRGSTSLSAKIE